MEPRAIVIVNIAGSATGTADRSYRQTVRILGITNISYITTLH